MNKKFLKKLIAAGATISPSTTPEASRSKYGSKKTVVDGIAFDSKREAERWSILKILQLGGEIVGLERQVRVPVVINGIKVCDFICDFRYGDERTGKIVYEDAKGFRTPVYKLKNRLVEAAHGIEILET